MNILKRNSTTINIATFWENCQLGKYNFEPAYQRPNEVWGEEKKSFLIDTILKNFPMPPIFLHQLIEPSSGRTLYDVIDGKQRLNAIMSFIKNEIRTPDDFNSDNFGDDKLAGIYFRDLERAEISIWKKIFWRYEITIEYIDTDQIEVVNNIFDRLNRNGEPLTRQELRNAKYHSTTVYKLIKSLSKLPDFEKIFEKIQTNRLEHEEFVSELLFSLISKQILTGDNPDLLDREYERFSDEKVFESIAQEVSDQFIAITKLLTSFDLDYDYFKIQGLSHFYALWIMTMYMYFANTDVKGIHNLLVEFYTKFRSNDKNEVIKTYKTSMSAGTKSKTRRTRRVAALLNYCGTGIEI
ncbi:MAG: DUF262 domain-containing protein [Chitinophagales bacterium]|nr:DUF262 domain-containing protein [Chitinophagales bacterium]